jgi:E3 ubiquitin-protein ligase CHFR
MLLVSLSSNLFVLSLNLFVVPSSKVVCYPCGLKLFKELAYQFRFHMKQGDIFPVAIRNRDNCYYGKKCRTQYAKPQHAQKLNHACDQTKF